MVFLLVFNFTFTFNISIDSGGFAWAQSTEDSLDRDLENETTQASKEAKKNVSGFWDSISSFFKTTGATIGSIINSMTSFVDNLFGFENGDGAKAAFAGPIYFLMAVVVIFALKFFYNILKDMVSKISSPTQERYRKPVRKTGR